MKILMLKTKRIQFFENENKNEDIITSEIENNITEQLPYSQNDDIPIVGVDDLEENENTCDTKFKEGDRIHNKKIWQRHH
ncbi:MAG: hypothetical protein L6V95_11830 [Candidatus Melainabacteria bacterium]|nr:MAG: hypothetical protein L6V95_11830 [Candidatus Melainabacteria bacterium]